MLSKQYGHPLKLASGGLVPAVVNPQLLEQQWDQTADLMNTKWRGNTFDQTWKGVIEKGAEAQFGTWKKLAAIRMSTPLASVACETGFSKVNLIKTKQRNRLGTRLLDELMEISVNGPALADLALTQLLERSWVGWLKAATRNPSKGTPGKARKVRKTKQVPVSEARAGEWGDLNLAERIEDPEPHNCDEDAEFLTWIC